MLGGFALIAMVLREVMWCGIFIFVATLALALAAGVGAFAYDFIRTVFGGWRKKDMLFSNKWSGRNSL